MLPTMHLFYTGFRPLVPPQKGQQTHTRTTANCILKMEHPVELPFLVWQVAV